MLFYHAKVRIFQQITTAIVIYCKHLVMLFYHAKVRIFQQITTAGERIVLEPWMLFYHAKVRIFQQITTLYNLTERVSFGGVRCEALLWLLSH